MQIRFVFRHMDPSKTLREYTEKKVGRLDKLSTKIIDVQATFVQEKADTIVELRANFQGHTAKALERDNDPYAAIDLVIDKFERQILRILARARENRHETIQPEYQPE